MMASLIDGKLFTILNASTDRNSFAFIARDDTSPSGFRTIYQPYEHLHGDPVDKQVTPKDAVNALGIADQKKNLVVYYLETFFGLTEKEARSVVQEAHAASN